MTEKFIYNDERFADIEMLRYPLLGFEALTLQQKLYIYSLSEATLYGRDITFDQFGRYNLLIRKTLEAVLRQYEGDRTTKDFLGFETYLKQVWFASGIHHHYGCEKFVPTFSEDFLRHEVLAIDPEALPLAPGQTAGELLDAICPVLFDPPSQTFRYLRINKYMLITWYRFIYSKSPYCLIKPGSDSIIAVMHPTPFTTPILPSRCSTIIYHIQITWIITFLQHLI